MLEKIQSRDERKRMSLVGLILAVIMRGFLVAHSWTAFDGWVKSFDITNRLSICWRALSIGVLIWNMQRDSRKRGRLSPELKSEGGHISFGSLLNGARVIECS